MRIFFTTPFSGKQYFQPYIDEVLAVLKKSRATIISPENPELYAKTIHEYESRGLQFSKAHYAFIANGIAEADIVIIEASQESLRVGHEITLALLYGKPTLVLSQNKNYANYISHELLTGAQYETKRELRALVNNFLTSAKIHLSPASARSAQTIEAAVDSLRLTTFATMRQHALQDDGDFGMLAELAEHDPEEAYRQVQQLFGDLPVEKPWSIFASIYTEDTPDFIFTGAIRFVVNELKKHGIKKRDHIVDAFTHSGSIARLLSQEGYKRLTAFSPSREMLAETYRACANNPEISIIESKPENLSLKESAKAIVWIDYTTNFALTETDLRRQLQTLIDNLQPGGCLLFDVRTINGWQAYFFREKVAAFATPSFQRISLNTTDKEAGLIFFDRFIRQKHTNGLWGKWQREQMTDRLWTFDEVKAIVKRLKNCKLSSIYDEDFSLVDKEQEPGLAYFVLVKNKL